MSRNLNELQLDYLKLMRDIELAEGEVTDEIAEQLAITADDVEDKLKGYRYVVKRVIGDAEVIKDDIKMYQARLANRNNLIKSLKNRMITALEMFGEVGKTGNHILDYGYAKYYTTNKQVVNIADESKFYNKDYMIFKFDEAMTNDELDKLLELYPDSSYKTSIDKKKLLADLKNEVEIDGVDIAISTSITMK